MADLVQLADLAAFKAWPGITVDDTQTDTVNAVLDAASALIRLESGDPDRWPTLAEVPASIAVVCKQVAARFWNNPDAAAMITTGPFSEQHVQGIEDALYLSEVNRRTIAAALGPVARPALWSLSVQRDDDDLYDDFGFIAVDGFVDPIMVPKDQV